MKLKETLYEQLFPPYWREGDESTNFLHSRWVEGVDDTASVVLNFFDSPGAYVDPLLCPKSLLPWLASWMDFDLVKWSNRLGWDEDKQREMVNFVAVNNRYKGTAYGIKLFVENFVDGAVVVKIEEPWQKILAWDDGEFDSQKAIMNHNEINTGIIVVTVIDGSDYLREIIEMTLDAGVVVYINELLTTVLELDAEVDPVTESSTLWDMISIATPDGWVTYDALGVADGLAFIDGPLMTIHSWIDEELTSESGIPLWSGDSFYAIGEVVFYVPYAYGSTDLDEDEDGYDTESSTDGDSAGYYVESPKMNGIFRYMGPIDLGDS